jgi:hypothetical protein
VYLRIIVVMYRQRGAAPAASRLVLLVSGLALFFTVATGVAVQVILGSLA